MGAAVRHTTILTLFFADDHVVISQDQENIEYMLRKLKKKKKYEKLNMYVCISTHTRDLIIDVKYFKAESKCYYLGTIITKEETHKEEIKERMSKAKKNCIAALNSVLLSKNVTNKNSHSL